MTEAIATVRGLEVTFVGSGRRVPAVRGIDFELYRGEVLGVVGESGSGKSVTALSMLGLLPDTAEVAGSVNIAGTEVVGSPESVVRKMRGRDIGIIFQDPMTTLNPVLPVGDQVTEGLFVHDLADRGDSDRIATGLLEEVQIPDAASRVHQYPHQFSGGMRQRAVIAMAIASRPSVIIADEPTTALDVTIQAQVLRVLKQVQADTGATVVLITHDLGVLVMYAGRIVEQGSVEDIFSRPRHPYTVGLMSSIPRLDATIDRLIPIPGQPPSPDDLPSGCPFNPRCPIGHDREICASEEPPLTMVSEHQASACHFPGEVRGLMAALPEVQG